MMGREQYYEDFIIWRSRKSHVKEKNSSHVYDLGVSSSVISWGCFTINPHKEVQILRPCYRSAGHLDEVLEIRLNPVAGDLTSHQNQPILLPETNNHLISNSLPSSASIKNHQLESRDRENIQTEFSQGHKNASQLNWERTFHDC